MIRLPPYRAQLATLAASPPSGDEWLHELKYDGYRMGCQIDRGSVRLLGRRGRDWTSGFPELVAALKALPVQSALLDGEVALALPNGTTSLHALRSSLAGAPRTGLTYFVFDLLHLDGQNLAHEPLERRKAECERLMRGLPRGCPLQYSRHFDVDGAMLLASACRLGAAGIVSKRRDEPYRPGQSEFWLVSKCSEQQQSGVRDSTDHAEVPSERPATAAVRQPGARTSNEMAMPEANVLGVPITTPQRLVYPQFGFTKLDLARLYAGLAELALPYIANRPLTLVRCEKGVHTHEALRRECKFLKHEPGWHRWVRPPIRRVQIQEQKKLGEYLVVDSAEGLIALVQGDILEIHVWNATVDHIEQPDRIVFDLDPGADVTWSQVVRAARLLRRALEKLGLECWPKLTGGKGLHVVLPFVAEYGWPEVYAFSRAVAESVVREQPASLTLDFARAARRAKILIDYKRNHRAAVAVAAYSARAHPAGALSVPIAWRELKSTLLPRAFTVRNIERRLRQDPWSDFWSCKQRLR